MKNLIVKNRWRHVVNQMTCSKKNTPLEM